MAAVCLVSAAWALIQGWNSYRRMQSIVRYRKDRDRYIDNFQLLSHWLEAKNNGGSAAEYFLNSGYKNIAVYGMGELANRLCEELADSDVQIRYGIDREVCGVISRMNRIYSPEEQLEQVDAIVVTPFYAMNEISSLLSVKVKCPVISLEEVIWSL